MKRAVVLMANGTEECEALIAANILKRAGIRVATASVNYTKTIRSSNGTKIITDIKVNKIDFTKVDMIVLPGGMPGTKNLYRKKIVHNILYHFHGRNKYIAAICAAPSILGALGLLKNKKATCYPGFEKYLKGAQIRHKHVVTDGNIITGSGLGNAIPFSLELVRQLKGGLAAYTVAKKIGFQYKEK